MSWPWDKHHKSKPLDPSLYSLAQRMAAEGLVPPDHPVWKQDERSEQRSYQLAAPEQLTQVKRVRVADPTDPVDDADESAPGTCTGCGARWHGLAIAHCPTCHMTFRSVSGFDKHRFNGTCRTAAEMRERGYEPNDDGHWRLPRPESTLPHP